jgi:hypothetical protein
VFWLAYCDEQKEDKGLRRDTADGVMEKRTVGVLRIFQKPGRMVLLLGFCVRDWESRTELTELTGVRSDSIGPKNSRPTEIRDRLVVPVPPLLIRPETLHLVELCFVLPPREEELRTRRFT